MILLWVLLESLIIHEGPTSQAHCTIPALTDRLVRPCPLLLHGGASSVEISYRNSACVLSSAVCPAGARDLVRCCPQLKEMWKCVVQEVE